MATSVGRVVELHSHTELDKTIELGIICRAVAELERRIAVLEGVTRALDAEVAALKSKTQNKETQ